MIKKCPNTGRQCTEDKCLAWGDILSVERYDQNTGQPVPKILGGGCLWFKVLIRPMKRK